MVTLLCVGLAMSGCTTAHSTLRRSAPPSTPPPVTSSTVPPTTSTRAIPSPLPACPPGCTLPSDFDAITVLASSATLVAVVTFNDSAGGGSSTSGTVSVDSVLQGNLHAEVYPPTPADLPRLLDQAHASGGQSYLMFTSFNRGGPCLSALFGYSATTQIASFISQGDGLGPGGTISLSGRMTSVPTAIDLADLRARLYPRGAVTYPADTGESFCPGP
jgi:hypothetical protein